VVICAARLPEPGDSSHTVFWVIKSGWLVRYVSAELPQPGDVLPFRADFRDDWTRWLDRADIPVGTPFLISPRFEYDVALNAFFCCPSMVGSARATQAGYAQDLGKFLTFLSTARGGRSWRDATEADHTAYLYWRRFDPAGPRISACSWDREVAAVNRFYCWQVSAGHVAVNPVPQRQRRSAPVEAGGRRGGAGETPATYSHGAGREKIEWFPAAAYRRWRDVGMRGYRPDGLPDPRFRGRWAARNATFCDLMVRTGLRLSEQAALTVFEVPLGRGVAGYRRFWLPAAIAKGGSARWVYVPGSVIADLSGYATIDRADVIARARAEGRYERLRQPLVVEDPERPVVTVSHPGGGAHHVKMSQLDGADRCRLLVDGPDGLEPAAFWLSEYGLPVATSTWKGLFAQANARCITRGVDLHGHAHLLRHTFAVITLEQLQRGHITALADLEPAQRGHYTRVFGDPLDWVRRRLGHRSVTTTMVYLHALAELEMETRMALVPDGWEHLGLIARHERDQDSAAELDGV
jgi:site-specific recombinase XerD